MTEDKEVDLLPFVVPSEERFKNAIQNLHESTVLCDSCREFVSTVFYPYGYLEEYGDMYYMGICPKCGAVMYTRD